MSKETEEILGMVLVGFVLLSLLSRNTMTTTAALNPSANATQLGFAADAAGIVTTAINDWS